MIAYINYLPHLEQSRQVAERAKESCIEHGLESELYPGIWRDNARYLMDSFELKQADYAKHLSNDDSVIGNFLTNYMLWEKIAAEKHTALILEHDAVVVEPLPCPAFAWPEITTVGKPSFGAYNKSREKGLQRFFSNALKHFKGAHAYVITPCGAKKAISVAQRHGVMPLDIFFHTDRFTLHEIYPWPVECHDSFTTIQLEEGCQAKHNWSEGYEIL